MSPLWRAEFLNLSRSAWRALPLSYVTRPTLNAPLLAFDDEAARDATLLQARIDHLAALRRRAFSADEKRTLAMRIRKHHLMRVSLAIGVRIPGRHIVWEFIDG